MEKINKLVSFISINFIRILFGIIIIGMLFVNSIYIYNDSPGFKSSNLYNYLGIIISILVVISLVLLDRFLLSRYKYTRRIIFFLFIVYFVTEIVYIKIIPIIPFSDMGNVVNIAMSNFTDGIDYLQCYPNNIPITIIFNLIFRFTTYDFTVLKLFNITCNMLTIFFAYKLYKNIYKKANKTVLLFGVVSISTFLYVNCLYTDICFTLLTTVILYIVTKEKNSEVDIIIISLLSFLQYKIRAVGIILIIALVMYYLIKHKNYKNVLILISAFVVSCLIYLPIERNIVPYEENKTYPIWSFIQMEINEEEFGFQNSSHSVEWTFQDVKDRINDIGTIRLLRLLSKKNFWMWTEGTFQVERYAFGTGAREQYLYRNMVVEEISDVENSKIRNLLEYMMKGQFFVFIILAFSDLVLKDKEQYTKQSKDILLYMIIGMFCFYTIWEMKSRYIYCLYPIFLVLAAGGVDKLIARANFEQNNTKLTLKNEVEQS